MLLHLSNAPLLIVRKHPVNIHDDQQPFGLIENTGDELLADTAREYHRRWWLDLAAMDTDNFRNGINDKPGHRAAHIHDYDAGLTAVFALHQAETPAH